MYRKKECVAMLLAGGQGSRLYVLTKNVAKPAVPFGGKYRIIDFPLSNCINSGIDTVGVLTQYEPHVLNAYIGSGQTWDLDRLRGGVSVLPPYQRGKASEWYKGTANAIYQNIPFIADYDPEYVLILSGDHIYKMDYNKMLRQHKETGADATIAVLDVPLSEASRFGIMNCKPDGTIYEFEEKPKEPKSTLASMGIYIFSWKKLRKYLEEDPLTGLNNRLAYDEMLDHLRGKEFPVGVGFLDINGMKWINDTLGHDMGNKVIQKICTILNEHIEQQYIYRISGDEFVMIWPDVDYKVFMSAAKKTGGGAVCREKHCIVWFFMGKRRRYRHCRLQGREGNADSKE